jgi:histone acetyltransferase (RNA polymerase elongator complex component)
MSTSGKPKIIPIFFFQEWCPHRCIFCNQRVTVGDETPPPPDEVPKIVETALKRIKNTSLPVEVAFYGASFTELPRDKEEAYLSVLSPFIKEDRVNGVRISTRPDSFDRSHLLFLKEKGVRTIELGAQSLDDNVLSLAKRGHSASDVEEGVKLLKEYGLKVGLQLMVGLPSEDEDSLRLTISRVIELQPDFVRIHPTLVLKDTELSLIYLRGDYKPLSLDEAIRKVALMLISFEEEGIKVIRVGLQPSPALESEGAIIAGPYHPSFRILVESRILKEMVIYGLRQADFEEGEVVIVVPSAMVSSLKGLRGENLRDIENNLPGVYLCVEQSPALSKNEMELIIPGKKISVRMVDVIKSFA